MNALAMRLFRSSAARLPEDRSNRLLDEVDHLLTQALEGQALELGSRHDNHRSATAEDYFRLVLKKTGWYSFIHPMRIGALYSPGDLPDLDQFNRFGHLLGAAFQVQDDVLNLTGATSSYGKEIGGDLSEGKRTLILTHALTNAAPQQADRLLSFLQLPGRERLPRQISDVTDILRTLGSVDWARSVSVDLASAARSEFSNAYAGAKDGPDLAFIRSLVDYVVDRDV